MDREEKMHVIENAYTFNFHAPTCREDDVKALRVWAPIHLQIRKGLLPRRTGTEPWTISGRVSRSSNTTRTTYLSTGGSSSKTKPREKTARVFMTWHNAQMRHDEVFLYVSRVYINRRLEILFLPIAPFSMSGRLISSTCIELIVWLHSVVVVGSIYTSIKLLKMLCGERCVVLFHLIFFCRQISNKDLAVVIVPARWVSCKLKMATLVKWLRRLRFCGGPGRGTSGDGPLVATLDPVLYRRGPPKLWGCQCLPTEGGPCCRMARQWAHICWSTTQALWSPVSASTSRAPIIRGPDAEHPIAVSWAARLNQMWWSPAAYPGLAGSSIITWTVGHCGAERWDPDPDAGLVQYLRSKAWLSRTSIRRASQVARPLLDRSYRYNASRINFRSIHQLLCVCVIQNRYCGPLLSVRVNRWKKCSRSEQARTSNEMTIQRE